MHLLSWYGFHSVDWNHRRLTKHWLSVQVENNGRKFGEARDVLQADMYAWDTKEMKQVVEEDPHKVEMTEVINMRPIAKMTPAKPVSDDDGPEVARGRLLEAAISSYHYVTTGSSL